MSQRISTCPNCGAEIVFRWAGALQTTCPACKSILVRYDVDLERVGVAADVPPAMSRIQLGTEGRFKGKPFVVIGRIVYRYQRGHWSEWHIRFANDTSAWLSDAQGEYAVTHAVDVRDSAPVRKLMRPGVTILIKDRDVTVSSITRAHYAGVEGELPFEYWDKSDVEFVDVKYGSDGFGTIDFSEEPPLVFLGEYEAFEELQLKNLREEDAAVAAEVRTRSLTCSQCGAAIELRTGDLAQTVACVACGAILDATDPGLAVIDKSQKTLKRARPAIPLGAVGSFKGQKWQVVGYQVRGITVEGVDYNWREYLLWNADAGFRYLTEYDGHWNDVSVIKGVPKTVKEGSHPEVEYLGRRFKHFQGAIATTRLVLGEFPWEARTNDTVKSDDYVSPPLMLSRETTADEVTWSMGTYTAPERIQEAFKLKQPLDKPTGVFANQPNPLTGLAASYWKVFFILLFLLGVVFALRHSTARDESVFAESYREYTNPLGRDAAFVTRVFELKGGPSNVAVEINTSLVNDWAYFNLALLSETGGYGYEFGREVSFYHGVDGGEKWSEGSSNDHVMLANVPPGRYYLRVDTERDARGAPFAYDIVVRRDVPRVWPFLVALLVFAVVPILAWVREKAFESARWGESDYAPTDDEEE